MAFLIFKYRVFPISAPSFLFLLARYSYSSGAVEKPHSVVTIDHSLKRKLSSGSLSSRWVSAAHSRKFSVSSSPAPSQRESTRRASTLCKCMLSVHTSDSYEPRSAVSQSISTGSPNAKGAFVRRALTNWRRRKPSLSQRRVCVMEGVWR